MTNLKSKVILCCTIGALGLLSVPCINAQSAEIGFRFMPTFSSGEVQTASGGKVVGDVTLGYGIGGVIGFNFNNHIGIKTEVIYNSISQKYKEQDVERKINLKYVNIPVLLSLNTSRGSLVNFNVVAGPQLGVSIGSNLTTTGTTGVDSMQAVLSVKKGDLGVAYGAGLDFGINRSRSVRFTIGYRGVLGLFDVSDNNRNLSNNSYYLLDKAHIKTNSVYIGLSYLFG